MSKAALGGAMLLGAGVTAYVLLKQRQLVKGSSSAPQATPTAAAASRAAVPAAWKAQGVQGVRQTSEDRRQISEERRQTSEEKSEANGHGCGRNAGPMADWQNKIHDASLVVSETLLMLRGGSMAVRDQLRRLGELLSETESTVQNAIYCTDREEALHQLMESLRPLRSSDASAMLLHPVSGEAFRGQLIDALESWDED